MLSLVLQNASSQSGPQTWFAGHFFYQKHMAKRSLENAPHAFISLIIIPFQEKVVLLHPEKKRPPFSGM